MHQAYVQCKIKYKKPMAQPIVLKINISRMQRSLPAPFLSKTYQLVDDSSTDDIISWNECGSTFVIWRPPEFSSDLLPNYFKHNNFSSFVRQLNTYGFKKTVTDRWEFANDFFKKGEKHLLIDIHRRKAVHLVSISPLPVKRPLSPSSPEEEQAASSGSSSDRGASPILSDETERLKTENMLLAAEVSCLRRLCMDLVLHIQRHTSLFGDNLAHVSRVFSHLHSHIITFDDKVSDQNPAREMRQVSDEHKPFMNEQSGNLLAICGASDGRQQSDPPKLFGVPLPCKGHRFSEPSLDHGHL